MSGRHPALPWETNGAPAWTQDERHVNAPVHRVVPDPQRGVLLACSGGKPSSGVVGSPVAFRQHRFWCVGCWGGERS